MLAEVQRINKDYNLGMSAVLKVLFFCVSSYKKRPDQDNGNVQKTQNNCT